MLAKSFRRNRKAVSPVIATIIIVAVAIVMSIAVAYWMLGLAGTFTRFEKLEFTSAYAINNNGGFTIRFSLKNTGTATATITNIFINGVPISDINASNSVSLYLNGSSVSASSISQAVPPGETISGNLTIPATEISGVGTITSGITIELKIQTAAGNEYPKSVTLP